MTAATEKIEDHMQLPRFEPTFNFGHVITSLTFLLSLGALVWWQSDFQATTRANQVVSEQMRQKYIPVIEGVDKAMDVTNDRLQNITAAIRDLRDVGNDITKEVNHLSNRITALESSVKNQPTRLGKLP